MASLIDRIARLEAKAVRPTTGKYLIFRVEAPHCTPGEKIITFLRARGHAIHEGDDVFLMNVGAQSVADGDPIRDLSPTLLTEQARAAASPAGRWPKGRKWFTFKLDTPGLHA